MPEVVRDAANAQPIVVGRYALFKELAAGGMATVHFGRLLGPVGFSRTIAVKRLHPQFAKDPDFVSMFLDEANLVSRIRHPNVVPTLDVVNSSTGLLLVMEYVHGESLSRLARKSRDAGIPMTPRLVSGLMSNVLLGLHAAHEARGASGEYLNIVHRDVSPQNVLVGADGIARVLDFGVAKAAGRSQTTREGQVKGKLAYMAPEQIRGKVDRRTDVFAAGIVLWELCAGRRMFEGEVEGQIIGRIIGGTFQSPATFAPNLPPPLVAAIMRALSLEPDARFATAREFAVELERAIGVASPSEVTDWVESLARNELHERAQYIESMERASAGLQPAKTDPPPASPNTIAHSGKFPVAPTPPAFDVEFTEISSGASRTNNAVFVSGESAPSSSRAWALAVVLVVLAVAGASMLAFAIYRMKHAEIAAGPNPSMSQTPKITEPIGSVAPSASSAIGTSPSASSSASSVSTTSSSEPASSTATAPSPSATASAAPTTAPQTAWTAWHPPPPGTHPTATATATATTHPTTAPTQTTAPTSKSKNCDPPFTIDLQGHRHYKPECD